MKWTPIKIAGLVVASSVLVSEATCFLFRPLLPARAALMSQPFLTTMMQQRMAGQMNRIQDARLKPGEPAPDFTCKTYDGRPFSLSNFRGKYVLLDFWGTRCGPCVAEMPNLKSTYDAFGKEERFAMISLSLDTDPEAPKKFARDHGMAWTQGVLAASWQSSTAQSFGVVAIPAIFLIGPDGKIMANDLRGAKIKEAVAAALNKS